MRVLNPENTHTRFGQCLQIQGESDISYISVVVATYNRAKTLNITVAKLLEQSLDRSEYEIVVVDDGSTDNTYGEIEKLLALEDVSIRYFRQERRGPGAAENHGISKAKGPWILLMADDIHADPHMVEAHYSKHQELPHDHIAVSGKVLQSPDLLDTAFQRHWDPWRYDRREDMRELSYIDFWANNISFKKRFMQQFGMFIERRAAAHEDVEVGWRLYRDGGLKLLYEKQALAFHYHPETVDTASQRAYEQGRNFDVLMENVPDPAMRVRYHLLDSKTLKFLAGDRKNGHADIHDEDRNLFWYVFRELISRCVYNRLTVKLLLMPLLRIADRREWLGIIVNSRMIRGTVAHHFRRGVSDCKSHQIMRKSQTPQ